MRQLKLEQLVILVLKKLVIKMEKKNIKKNKGFTLIEMLVAMTLFSFVITIALGALFTILKANEKAKIMKTVVNNLNVALEGMSREIRVGSEYNNSNGSTSHFKFKTKEGCVGEYKLEDKLIKRRIKRKDPEDPSSVCGDKGDANFVAITGSDMEITDLSFNITGVGADSFQPRVLILLKGKIDRPNINEVFNIQTTISQRKIEQ
jgi:prepilin-type N-terminal cleavage/methylation domain-containing protein